MFCILLLLVFTEFLTMRFMPARLRNSISFVFGREAPQLPLFTTHAHVFQIDPVTKKSWLPISKQAVNVSFYFDNIKSAYKILSIDGGKVIVNCTFDQPLVFTKTSQKFGQWADTKAATVFGLGFPNETELSKFSEKFNEIKSHIEKLNLSEEGNSKNSSVQIVTPPLTLRGNEQSNGFVATDGSIKSASSSSTEDGTQSPGSHRSSSSSSESQLKYENDRLKKALAQSSANTKEWEAEFQTLKNNNARLTAALQESAVNVEKWKEQLNNYKEENARLRKKQNVHSTENTRELQEKLYETEMKLKKKEEEISRLSQHSSEELHLLREKNSELVKKLQLLELEKKQSNNNRGASSNDVMRWNQANDVRQEMDVKMRELATLQQKMNNLFGKHH